MPPKNIKKPKKNNGKDQAGILQREERVRWERAHLNVEMKSFQQPTIKESLASQGMTLRGHSLRAEQGDMKEGTYMELVGSDNENKAGENPLLPPTSTGTTPSPPLPPKALGKRT